MEDFEGFETLALGFFLDTSQMCTEFCGDLVTGYCLCLAKIRFLTVIRFRVDFVCLLRGMQNAKKAPRGNGQ